MPYTDKQKEYLLRYQRENMRQIKFALAKSTDADVIAYLDTIPNKRAYLIDLIRADMARAKSGKEGKPMIKITFEAGTSRNGDHGVNYMMPAPGADSPELYAEIPVPEGADEEYGYLTLKDEIIRQAVAQNIDPATLAFWYDGQENLLSSAARATAGAKSISLDNGHTYLTAAEAMPEITVRNLWETVVELMDDDTRETVASEGHDDEGSFLARYLELAPADLIIG